jgi:Raf kinase inhibitor-like YbhB/YbcL family protein
MKITIIVFLCLISVVSVTQGGAGMKITSPVFAHNQYIPKKYSGEGDDVNPPLVIENIPVGTKSLALIVDDPDAPRGTWVHWVVFNISMTNKIDEDSVPGTLGITNSGKNAYHGPYPPSGTHRYFFKIYALDELLDLNEGVDKYTLEKSMHGHILGSAELIGLYKRE